MRPLIPVDCDLRLGESEGAQRFNNLPRQQHAAGHHPEAETDSPSPRRTASVRSAVETMPFRLESGSLP